LTYEQSSGLTMLDAKSTLRNYSKSVDITIADLTWTYGMSHDFMHEFDVIIVPSSLSQIETASSEIFILEYIQSNAAKFSAKEQYILLVPSRIEPGQHSESVFAGLNFLKTCFICPPIYRIPDINKHLHVSYFFESQDPSIADNFCEFGNFVFEKLQEKMANSVPRKVANPNYSIRGNTVLGQKSMQNIRPVVNPPSSFKSELKPKAVEKDSFLGFIPAFLRRK
jgi:hypothetical protein